MSGSIIIGIVIFLTFFGYISFLLMQERNNMGKKVILEIKYSLNQKFKDHLPSILVSSFYSYLVMGVILYFSYLSSKKSFELMGETLTFSQYFLDPFVLLLFSFPLTFPLIVILFINNKITCYERSIKYVNPSITNFINKKASDKEIMYAQILNFSIEDNRLFLKIEGDRDEIISIDDITNREELNELLSEKINQKDSISNSHTVEKKKSFVNDKNNLLSIKFNGIKDIFDNRSYINIILLILVIFFFFVPFTMSNSSIIEYAPFIIMAVALLSILYNLKKIAISNEGITMAVYGKTLNFTQINYFRIEKGILFISVNDGFSLGYGNEYKVKNLKHQELEQIDSILQNKGVEKK